MSVALDLDSLLVSHPASVRRPSLSVVPCEPEAAPPARPLADLRHEATVSVLHAPSPSSIAAPLRLTRRGVAVLATLTAVLGAALVWAAAVSGADSAPGGTAVAPTLATVTVRSGDTLWAVASRIAPGSDPRAEVAHLRRLNHLADPGLQPGQILRVR